MVPDDPDGLVVAIASRDNGYVVVRETGLRCAGIGRRLCEIMGLDGAGKETCPDVADMVASSLQGDTVAVFAWTEVRNDVRHTALLLTRQTSRPTAVQNSSLFRMIVTDWLDSSAATTWLCGWSPLRHGFL